MGIMERFVIIIYFGMGLFFLSFVLLLIWIIYRDCCCVWVKRIGRNMLGNRSLVVSGGLFILLMCFFMCIVLWIGLLDVEGKGICLGGW